MKRTEESTMVSKKVKVVNSQGFHMRPVTAFVGAMGKYGSDVKIVSKGNEINGKSLMGIVAACIKCGEEIEVQCSGDDEEAALQEAVGMIESGFGEE